MSSAREHAQQLKPNHLYVCDKELFGFVNKNLNDAGKFARVTFIGDELVEFEIAEGTRQ